MAWSFGDSFDLYSVAADMANNYWDPPASPGFVAGRFAGSRAIFFSGGNSTNLTKSSGVNDAAHHFVISYQAPGTISGTAGCWISLLDGTTAQCTIFIRNDGTILLQSGAIGGATLATYSGAFNTINTWYAFEFEIVINNTTGAFRVRKNGNNVNDFDSGAVLNTRPVSTNNYANKVQLGTVTTNPNVAIDDFFWQSGAAAGAWLGDLRCYTRMPASDQSVQFSRTNPVQAPWSPSGSTFSINAGQSWYMPFTPSATGTVSTATVQLNLGYTGNMKCSFFLADGTNGPAYPGTVLASATPISNPITGANTFTFPTPFTITKGTSYWIAFCSDTSVTNGWAATLAGTGRSANGTYAAFPVTNQSGTSGTNNITSSWPITTTVSASLVSEPQQDGLASYVYDSNPGDADFYGIASIASTPAAVIATTIRVYAQKSDIGTRTAAVQLKSGATTVASPTLTLTTSGWQWAWRTDLTDPNTGAAWTAAGVNNAQIGPKVIA